MINGKLSAAWVAESIKADGIMEQFVNATEVQRHWVVIAYLEAQAKQIEKFQTKYITNTEFRDDFRLAIYAMLKGEDC